MTSAPDGEAIDLPRPCLSPCSNLDTAHAAAAELGVSRRLVAYHAKDRLIPRCVALACAYLDRPGPDNDALRRLGRWPGPAGHL